MPESTHLRPHATASAELPADFHEPAPLREPGRLSEGAEQGYLRSRTVSLSLLRMVSLGAGLPWLAYMLLGVYGRRELVEGSPFSADPLISSVWLLLISLAVVVIYAGFIHRERFYFWSMLTAGGIFVAILLVHVSLMLVTGDSPLKEMYLGDFTGLPVALMVTVLPSPWALGMALVGVAAAAAVNQGSPLGFNMALEIAHSVLVMLPFLLFLQSGHRVARLLDDLATQAHITASRLARTKALRELETRFLGYLHDNVMNTLDAIRRGVREPEISALGFRTFETDTAAGSVQLSAQEVVEELIWQLRELAPNLQIHAPGKLPESVTIPADISAVLGDAALEAAHNTLRHATGAPAYAEIDVELDGEECIGLKVRIRDEGPGFDPEKIPASRAGLRVAIAGRMHAVDGCDLELHTAPGEGTEIILSWHRDGPVGTSSDVEVPTAYDLVGMGRVFRPRNVLIAWGVFSAMSLNNAHHSPWLWIFSLALVLIALLMCVQGDQLRLPLSSTLVAAVAALVFFTVARLDLAGAAPLWPRAWYPWVFILLCSYLALRDRGWVAWGTWGVGLITSELLSQRYFTEPAAVASAIALSSAVLLPATLIPAIIKMTARALPLALAASQDEVTSIEVVTGQRRFLSDTSTWISRQVSAILEPRFPADIRRTNAHLLELKLRDAIRSPAFVSAELNRAVWDARAAGRGVQILDDRSQQGTPPNQEDHLPLRKLHERLVQLLENEDFRELTVRLFPVGRAHFATILITPLKGEEIHRVDIANESSTPEVG